jgi:anti-anti-sigma factor
MTAEPDGEQPSELAVLTAQFDSTRASVCVTGGLHGGTAQLLEAVLGDHLEAGRRYVRLDVSGLSHIDTVGLRVLLDAHHRYLTNRGTLVLTGIRPPTVRLLRSHGLDNVLLYTTAQCDNFIGPPRPLIPVGGYGARPALTTERIHTPSSFPSPPASRFRQSAVAR